MEVEKTNQEDLTPKSLLEKLKSEDIKQKTFAVKNSQILFTTIGPDRSRKELIPYLINCIDLEEEEVLIEFAKVIGSSLDILGVKVYFKDIFPAFELIFSSDDYAVRKEGILALKFFLSQITFKDIEEDAIELIKKLGNGEESANKISCIDLISLTYHLFGDKKKTELMNLLKAFLTNPCAMVRSELALSLKDISLYCSFENFQLFINAFISDENDAIRIQIMECIIALQSHKNLGQYMNYLNQILKKLGNDESWRVRLTVGDKLSYFILIPSLTNDIKTTIIEVYAKLFEDPEAEVRNICCLKLEVITEALCNRPNYDLVLSKLKLIEKDTISYVKTSLASTLLRICTLIGVNKTNEFIFPVFLNLIKDEDHDIRMTLIKTLDQLHEVLNIDNFIQGIIPSFNEISNNKNWRIRIQVSESIPVLARILSKKPFIESILGICIAWLTDPVFAIRESACKLMKKLYEIFKGEDFEKKLLDKLNEMRQSESYLVRNTVLMLIKEFLADEFIQDFVERKLSPFVFKLAKDKTPNIRMNSAIILKKMTKCKSKDVAREISNLLDDMKMDKDLEVIYALNNN